MQSELQDMIYFFGYADLCPESSESSHSQQSSVEQHQSGAGFFKYDRNTDREQGKNYMGYRTLNKQMIDWNSKLEPKMLAEF